MNSKSQGLNILSFNGETNKQAQSQMKHNSDSKYLDQTTKFETTFNISQLNQTKLNQTQFQNISAVLPIQETDEDRKVDQDWKIMMQDLEFTKREVIDRGIELDLEFDQILRQSLINQQDSNKHFVEEDEIENIKELSLDDFIKQGEYDNQERLNPIFLNECFQSLQQLENNIAIFEQRDDPLSDYYVQEWKRSRSALSQQGSAFEQLEIDKQQQLTNSQLIEQQEVMID